MVLHSFQCCYIPSIHRSIGTNARYDAIIAAPLDGLDVSFVSRNMMGKRKGGATVYVDTRSGRDGNFVTTMTILDADRLYRWTGNRYTMRFFQPV